MLGSPVTKAISERSFSAVYRQKTWLHTTISQRILNWHVVLHEHEEKNN